MRPVLLFIAGSGRGIIPYNNIVVRIVMLS